VDTDVDKKLTDVTPSETYLDLAYFGLYKNVTNGKGKFVTYISMPVTKLKDKRLCY
jgi:hypothetical protein